MFRAAREAGSRLLDRVFEAEVLLRESADASQSILCMQLEVSGGTHQQSSSPNRPLPIVCAHTSRKPKRGVFIILEYVASHPNMLTPVARSLSHPSESSSRRQMHCATHESIAMLVPGFRKAVRRGNSSLLWQSLHVSIADVLELETLGYLEVLEKAKSEELLHMSGKGRFDLPRAEDEGILKRK